MKKIEEIWFIYKNRIILTAIVSFLSIVAFICIYFFNISKAKADSIEFNEGSIIEKKNNNSNVEDEMLTIKVDIKGEVRKPGVYELSSNSRVNDLISKAGGITSNADTSVTNLSKILTDEMVVIIYSKKEVQSFSETKKKEQNSNIKCKNEEKLINGSCISSENYKSLEQSKSTFVNINTATLEQLMSISGIGESKAKSIIEYRNTNGKFKRIEDIMNVSGIGQSLFDKIKESITI